MVAWQSWLDQNWFSLVQTLGILGGVGLTAAALRRDTRARKIGDYLILTGQHRELWSEVHRRPELSRILKAEVDLLASPLSVAEEEFLNLAIEHSQTGCLLARAGSPIRLSSLSSDARSFFTLPLPRVVWEKTKHARDPRFVRFIEQAIASLSR